MKEYLNRQQIAELKELFGDSPVIHRTGESRPAFMDDDGDSVLFNLEDLLSILPQEIQGEYTLYIERWNPGEWKAYYGTPDFHGTDILAEGYGNEMVDALFGLFVELKKNNLA